MNIRIWSKEEENCLAEFVKTHSMPQAKDALVYMAASGFTEKTERQVRNKLIAFRRLFFIIDDESIQIVKEIWNKYPPEVIALKLGQIGLRRAVDIAKVAGVVSKSAEWESFVSNGKVCSQCKKYKDRFNYSVDPTTMDGLKRSCKACIRIINRVNVESWRRKKSEH